MSAVAIAHEDAAKALEAVVAVADEVERLLTGGIAKEHRSVLKGMVKRCEAIREILEDALDGMEADAALAEVDQVGTVSWKDVKAEHGL